MGIYLKSKGISKTWLAEQIEAERSQVSNWCKNIDGVAKSTPSVGYLIRIMNVLNVHDIAELFEEVS
ncbi:helix-turn-helix domain-containing protein [Halalkalibacter krulwichiae]|uniref:helix-turn-helix domain-containing protein n=1 Tax=Halalkalibacter krulwichiae TaxID=199441 RepID=UPI001470BF1B|nr:helix-turn-helix transcriptional regulator [Halalkalibacter krulwichiae]